MAAKGKKGGDLEANPFSFKNFVTGGPQADFVSDEEEEKPLPDVTAVKSSKPKAKSKKSSTKATSAKTPSVAPVAPVVDLFAADDGPLSVPGPTAKPAAPVLKKGALADEKSNPFSFNSFVKRDPAPSILPQPGDASSEDDWGANSSSELSSGQLPPRPSVTIGLPSSRNVFSSDENEDDDDDSHRGTLVAVAAAAGVGKGSVQTSSGKSSEKLLLEKLEKLQEENNKLVQDLKAAEDKASSEKKRCQKLKKQLEVQQKRESEETAALERAVQMVEKNLETSTKRAVAAEKKVEMLQQQLLLAQSQKSTDSMQALHAQQLVAVREKGNMASAKLMLAAQQADKSIRELMGGVESLKYVADLLASIDRFAEVPPGVD